MKAVNYILVFIVAFGLGFALNEVLMNKKNDSQQKVPNDNIGRVTGIGGVFFKCEDTQKIKDWYKVHLGLDTDEYGTTFEWRQADDANKSCHPATWTGNLDQNGLNADGQ